MKENAQDIAVIIMGHGSRVPGAAEGMEQVASRLREGRHYRTVKTCSMSQLGPRFRETLSECVVQGAASVVVVPYFLHTGMHVRSDIPTMMQEAAAAFPGVRIVLGPNLGYDDCLVDLVAKRVGESAELCDIRELELAPPEAPLESKDE